MILLLKQLKDVAERMPEGQIGSCNSGSMAGHAINFADQLSKESHLTNITTPDLSNGNSMDRILANGTKGQTGKAERVLQDEPGVYITLCSLPDGGNELRRVRFRYISLPLPAFPSAPLFFEVYKYNQVNIYLSREMVGLILCTENSNVVLQSETFH